MTVVPFKADTPLVIYPDTELPSPVARQFFQPVAGRHTHICQIPCGVKPLEFPHGDPLKGFPSPDGYPVEQMFRIRTFETLNHKDGDILTDSVMSVKPVRKEFANNERDVRTRKSALR